ncbi:hypothetical protein A2382_00105 [Candidatus Woesebacteria bacterium RIFOXYB1_FULL_38_16]|uniref:Uncharacterized protein n=1 Tax=Candidatus Woesebacteria bacterium RIFOXYB1_FULL_38_16 TaxID=1802538 RepID=A0A1F8CV25_9BACT|nr:MAG: hypothetical protein A2191_00775 [Candidatus Woesebacteria bacterium RIFOXYA1_FULL_38_9]OGM80177.1 MAG: hypothetical protein A2382_00105 [Candidatus Woesebacteria bacterium RIFOXYB1_FULL_38_16]
MTTQKISEPVSVSLSYNSQRQEVFPKWVVWHGRVYPILKVGLHHTYTQGKTLFHVFSVVSKSIFFRLELNTKTLHWRLESIANDL